jgi:hypothetical protein
MKVASFWGGLLLLAAAAHGAEGELRSVAAQRGEVLQYSRPTAQTGQFSPALKASGTVSPTAVVGGLRIGSKVIPVAVDARKAGAKGPDVLRFDVTGRGKFHQATVVPLQVRSFRPGAQGAYLYAAFGPVELQLSHEGRIVRANVSGYCRQSGRQTMLSAYVHTALAGTCRFGQRVLGVRIVDGDGDLDCGDTLVLLVRGPEGKPTRQTSYFGHPVLVDGRWYNVTVSPDRKQVRATPSAQPTGKLQVANDRWELELASERLVLRLEGGKAPLPVPAGSYRLASYVQHTAATSEGRRGGFRCMYGGRGGTVSVAAGATVHPQLGTPLVAGVSVQKRVGRLYLNLALHDAAGGRVVTLQLPTGGRPPPPTVKVLDEKGNVVHEGAMRYG